MTLSPFGRRLLEEVELFERAGARAARRRVRDDGYERLEPRRRHPSPSAERRARRRRSG